MAIGNCLCGAIAYRLDGPFQLMMHCHCSRCRKHHGSAFATFVGAPERGFEWLSGRDKVTRWLGPTNMPRFFCPTCGSVVPAPEPQGELRFVPAGTLLTDCGVKPVAHIFAASKAPWYTITDTVRQYDGPPPGYDDPNIATEVREPDAPAAIGGSCLCGAVRFEIDGNPLGMVNCHCSRCRRGRSAAHATNLFTTFEQFRWTRGERHVRVFDLPGADRFGTNFCGICGSDVPRHSPKIGRVNIPSGCLDTDPRVRPGYHIFVGSKAPWYDITDTLPQFDTTAP
jgi:hypothetical protein